MSGFSIDPEVVRTGTDALFDASDQIYDAMNKLAGESDKLEGSPEAAGFTGIAECLEASQVWETKYIAVLRADIEDTAMLAAVCLESNEDVDSLISSTFEQYADEYYDGRTSPVPERPGPDPSAQMPRDGESVVV